MDADELHATAPAYVPQEQLDIRETLVQAFAQEANMTQYAHQEAFMEQKYASESREMEMAVADMKTQLGQIHTQALDQRNLDENALRERLKQKVVTNIRY